MLPLSKTKTEAPSANASSTGKENTLFPSLVRTQETAAGKVNGRASSVAVAESSVFTIRLSAVNSRGWNMLHGPDSISVPSAPF